MSIRITWWGHASATVEIGGVRILTDPLFAARLVHLRRIGSPAPPPSAAQADGVVISHLHLDHLHVPSLRTVPGSARLVVPAGAAPLVRSLAAQAVEVTAGDVLDIGDVTVRAVPARHDGRRLPGSRRHGPALGYVLEHAGARVWFAGDTGLFDGLADIGPVDVAIVPVGGWGPTLGPEHLDSVAAAMAVELVGARHAVPVHFGTYWPVGLRGLAPGTFTRLFREPGTRFAAALADRGVAAQAHVLAPGGSVTLT